MSEERQLHKKRVWNESRNSSSLSPLCKHCQSQIHDDEPFCPECGAAWSEGLRPCQSCGLPGVGANCENCGAELEPKPCPTCGSAAGGDWCPSCGFALSSLALEIEKAGILPGVRELDEEEAASIESELHELLTPEMLKLQEKLEQRAMFARERQYARDLEQRLLEFNSKSGFKVILLPTEEMDLVRKAQESLSGFVARQNEREEARRREKDELEQLEELARQKRDVERKQLEASRAVAKEQERVQFLNRVVGTYIMTSGRMRGVLKIVLREGVLEGSHTWSQTGGRGVDYLSATFDGRNLHFWSTRVKVEWSSHTGAWLPFDFHGTVSDYGESITGFMKANAHWQEHYIKQ